MPTKRPLGSCRRNRPQRSRAEIPTVEGVAQHVTAQQPPALRLGKDDERVGKSRYKREELEERELTLSVPEENDGDGFGLERRAAGCWYHQVDRRSCRWWDGVISGSDHPVERGDVDPAGTERESAGSRVVDDGRAVSDPRTLDAASSFESSARSSAWKPDRGRVSLPVCSSTQASGISDVLTAGARSRSRSFETRLDSFTTGSTPLESLLRRGRQSSRRGSRIGGRRRRRDRGR